MGTNYYARIKPEKKTIVALKNAIKSNDFDAIKNIVYDSYSGPHYSYDKGTFIGGEVYLGKASYGWKFLWNPNIYKHTKGHYDYEEDRWVEDGLIVHRYYDLTKKAIKDFIDRDDVVIFDEYGIKQDKEEFFKMAIEWGKSHSNGGYDHDSYDEEESKKNPSYRSYSHKNEYTDFLEKCGFSLNRLKSEFYSDGLRFATTTDFS